MTLLKIKSMLPGYCEAVVSEDIIKLYKDEDIKRFNIIFINKGVDWVLFDQYVSFTGCMRKVEDLITVDDLLKQYHVCQKLINAGCDYVTHKIRVGNKL